jgi:TPR repeat protein
MEVLIKAAVLVLALPPAAILAQAQLPQYQGYYTQTYYTWNGTSLMALHNTQGIACDHWAVMLYSDSAQPPLLPAWEFDSRGKPLGAFSWGEVDGASAADVQQKLEKSRSDEAWALDLPSGQIPSGYKVTLGPVCVVYPTSHQNLSLEITNRINNLGRKIESSQDFAKQVYDAWKALAGSSNLYALDKAPLQNYLESLSRIKKQYENLERLANDATAPQIAQINTQIEALNRQLAAASDAGNKLETSLGAVDDTSWSGKTASYSQFEGNHTTEVVTISGAGINLRREEDYRHAQDDPSIYGVCGPDGRDESVGCQDVQDIDVPFDNIQRARAGSANSSVVSLDFKPEATLHRNYDGVQSVFPVWSRTVNFASPQDADNFMRFVNRKIEPATKDATGKRGAQPAAPLTTGVPILGQRLGSATKDTIGKGGAQSAAPLTTGLSVLDERPGPATKDATGKRGAQPAAPLTTGLPILDERLGPPTKETIGKGGAQPAAPPTTGLPILDLRLGPPTKDTISKGGAQPAAPFTTGLPILDLRLGPPTKDVADAAYNRKDYASARQQYEQLAHQGSSSAMLRLGLLYRRGLGVSQDYAQAVAWYRKAADAGNPGGMTNLGVSYALGEGVAKDYGQAMAWYRKAADAGDARGMTNLGVSYARGEGVAKDYGQAVAWYRKGADAGDAGGMTDLGNSYENGRGVAKDYGQAVAWYRKAADAGDPSGMAYLGNMYARGDGLARDYGQAVAWYRKAAEKGDPRGMNFLGMAYDEAKDYGQAVAWYRKAADAGDTDAMENLGFMYEHGLGVAKDYAQAAAWDRKALAAGDENAKWALKHLGK